VRKGGALTTMPPDNPDWLIFADGVVAVVWDYEIEEVDKEKFIWIQYKLEKDELKWQKVHHRDVFDRETGVTITKRYPYRFFSMNIHPRIKRIMLSCDMEGRNDYVQAREGQLLEEVRMRDAQVKRLSDSVFLLQEELRKAGGNVFEYVSEAAQIFGEAKKVTEPTIPARGNTVEEVNYE